MLLKAAWLTCRASGMSHSRNLVRASSLAASRRSFCCRMMLSAISLYLLKALALQASVKITQLCHLLCSCRALALPATCLQQLLLFAAFAQSLNVQAVRNTGR